MNQTFSAMAAVVDEALQEYRDRDGEVKRLEAELADARRDREAARDALAVARDSLFDAHPELAPSRAPEPVPMPDVPWQPPGGGLSFEPVEVDDPDDVPDFSEGGRR